MKIERVAVVGAGNIGIGVITDLVLNGLNVMAVDVSKEQLKRAEAGVLKNIRFAPMLLKGTPRLVREDAVKRMVFTEDMNDIASCDFIIENVTENWDIKKGVYETLDQVAPPAVCFGANTSCISITKIGDVTKRPAQVVGMHLMNPVHLKSSVEVIRGCHTSDLTIEVVQQLLRRLNKQAIIVGDLPGFVSNRISHLFMNEAAFVLQDNIATAGQIDAIFKQCFGHKMGPLETADLIGLDTVMHSLNVLFEAYHDPKFRCCPLLRKMVDAGHLGRKTGRGFHIYPD
jgi:3-hydroxybutyryl-CoA dehydrogenase